MRFAFLCAAVAALCAAPAPVLAADDAPPATHGSAGWEA